MRRIKGRIVDIMKKQDYDTFVVRGIKEPDQHKFVNYSGGNGTYVVGSEYYGTQLLVKVYIYDLEQCVKFDVYNDVKELANVKRISNQLLNKIYSHKGEKIDLFVANDVSYTFDARLLLA